MRAAYNEMKQAGLSHTDVLFEVLGALFVILVPLALLFASELIK